ncbi:hypothetical protein WDW37_00025 [Bdellovibrionota bacterium FG-1]
MPSFSEAMGVIVTVIVLATASGHGDWVWRGITEIRRVAITNAQQDFGCPSLFAGHSACTSYNSARYR